MNSLVHTRTNERAKWYRANKAVCTYIGDDGRMIDEQKTTDVSSLADDEYFCIDPEAGEDRLDGYVAETLTAAQRQAFEAHLPFCDKCRQELNYVQWALRRLAASTPSDNALPIIELTDFFKENLLFEYDEAPLFGQMAAAGHPHKSLEFPLPVAYDNGTARVRGEFWRRGTCLTYRLLECQPEQTYTLTYTVRDSGAMNAVALRNNEEVLICAIEDLTDTNDPRQLLQAIKEMRLTVCSN